MREYQRRPFEVERPKLNLRRDESGRLRTGSPDLPRVSVDDDALRDDITDVWAEQPEEVQPHINEVVSEVRQDYFQEEEARPRLRKPKINLFKITARLRGLRKQHWVAGGVLTALVALCVVSFGLIGGSEEVAHQQTPTVTTGVLNATSVDGEVIDGPQFDAILPGDKTIDSLGGWIRVSPLDKDPVFAYTDNVDGVKLNISQQQLPEALRNNTSQELQKLAEGFAANEKISLDGMMAYMGTSVKGPQSVIFVKNGLLILIKSSGTLTTDQWKNYLSSLR